MQLNPKTPSSDLSLDGLEGLLNSQAPGQDAATAIDEQDWTVEETSRALGLSRGAVIRRLEDGILTGYRLKRSFGWVWRVKPSWVQGSKKAEAESRVENDNAAIPCTVALNEPSTGADLADTTDSADSGDKEESSSGVLNFSCAAAQLSKEPVAESCLEDAVSDKAHSGMSQPQAGYVEVFDVCEESLGSMSLSSESFRELVELKAKLQLTELRFQEANGKLDSAHQKIGYLEAKLESSQEQIKLLGDSQMPWWKKWQHLFRAQ